jgi:hypothetical protein
MQRFLQQHLASGPLLWQGGEERDESTGTSKPEAVVRNVSQRAGSKVSLMIVGRMVHQERGLQKRTLVLTLSACSSKQFISTLRVCSHSNAHKCPIFVEMEEDGGKLPIVQGS